MLQPDTSVKKLDINLIIPNKYQPRKVFDDKSLSSLAESIKTYGIINPILVRQKEGKYEIIAGERRFRAAKSLGLAEVPVIIKNADEQQMAELALIENIQRQGLSPIEEAKSYEEIMRIGNQTQASLATKLGKSQAAIANKIRLLSLPEEIQDALANKKISERHARSLIKVEDKERQIEILNRIITEKLTVKETDQIINEKEITEEEIKQAISDIMKSLNIEENSNIEDSEIKEEDKKEEKEEDNMNNGNFFPNFDNNNVLNNNASLNTMNLQSMNQGIIAPEQEMVMPTMNPIQEQPMMAPEGQPIPTFNQFNQGPIVTPEQNIPNNFNPMDSFMTPQEPVMVQDNSMGQPLNFVEEPQLVVPTPTVEMQPQMVTPEPQPVSALMMDAPLFNPNITMPSPDQTMTFNGMPTGFASEPVLTPEVPTMMQPNYEVPLTSPEPMMMPQVDRLTELQNLLSSNGYNYKVFSNETENCIIIELPKN